MAPPQGRGDLYFIEVHEVHEVIYSSAEVAAGIAAIILKGSLKDVIEDRMRDGMETYGKNVSSI
jgi:hypothetical protein